jgi:Flp pilus assembly protein TadG
MRIRKLKRANTGQALVETLLMMPILLSLVLNAINFGYFFLMALNITSASRSSGVYSIVGGATPAGIALPNAGNMTNCTGSTSSPTVSCLALQDLTGAVYTPSGSNTGGQVCSPSVGVLNAGTVNQQSQCSAFGSSARAGAFGPAGPDPELNSGNSAPAFMLNRVDVGYTFRTPIPLMPLNIIVLAAPACTSSGGTVTCTFVRHVSMRAMQ